MVQLQAHRPRPWGRDAYLVLTQSHPGIPDSVGFPHVHLPLMGSTECHNHRVYYHCCKSHMDTQPTEFRGVHPSKGVSVNATDVLL